MPPPYPPPPPPPVMLVVEPLLFNGVSANRGCGVSGAGATGEKVGNGRGLEESRKPRRDRPRIDDSLRIVFVLFSV